MLKRWHIGIIALLALIAGVFYFVENHVSHISGPIVEQAYIMQPAWSDSLRQAISDHGGSFDELIFYAAEISDSPQGPVFAVNPVDFKWLAQQHVRAGLMIEIDSMPPNTDAGPALASAVRDLLGKASAAGATPVDLQLDYPVPSSQLPDLVPWIQKAQSAGPTPISVIAEPDWLSTSEFPAVAKTAGSFVLRESSSPNLDPDQARRDVERAAHVGVPFRVSLPTYRSMGSSAAADPAAMAGLIQSWVASRPELLHAVTWDRFTSDDDPSAWRWVTLQSVMSGVVPQANVQVQVRHVEPTLSEIDLVNSGTADGSFTSNVAVTWNDADLSDYRALPDFDEKVTGRRSLTLVPQPTLSDRPVRPGEQRAIGWVRLTDDSNVFAKPDDSAATNP